LPRPVLLLNVEFNTTDEDLYEEAADSSSFEQFINIQQEEEDEKIEEDMTVEVEFGQCETD